MNSPFLWKLFFAAILASQGAADDVRSEPARRLLWESPVKIIAGEVWLSSESARKIESESSEINETSMRFSSLPEGWYKVNFREPGSPVRSSQWLPIYAGWEAALVWDPRKSEFTDLETCQASMHSASPNLLLGKNLVVDFSLPISNEQLKKLIPFAVDARTVVLANNVREAVMAKGGLSCSWNRGTPFYRRNPDAPWVYVAQEDPLSFAEYLLVTKSNPHLQDDINPNRKTQEDFGKGNGWLPWPESNVLTQLQPLSEREDQGKLQNFVLDGFQEGYSKQVTVYLPAGYSVNGPGYPTIYLHDVKCTCNSGSPMPLIVGSKRGKLNLLWPSL